MNWKTSTAALLALGVVMSVAGAAPAQQAARPAQRCFIAYFPAGSGEPSSSTQTVIQSAATYAASGGAVKVTGHADGAEVADTALTRATAVTQALVTAGVARSSITVDSAGFTKPAVPTAGAEPLNRRVEMCVTPATS